MTTIIVAGDRHWDDLGLIRAALEDVKPSVVIHGGAQGADYLAGRAAIALGIKVIVHFADWKTYGKAAGPIRNQLMLDQHPETARLVAFHDWLDNSKGTRDMVARAKARGLPVSLYSHVGLDEF